MEMTTIAFEETNVYCESAGRGEAIVFCHAAFLDRRMWDEPFEALSKEYRVVRYDGIGYGDSDRARGAVCRRDELKAVLDGLGIDRAHLVGCSNGGMTALDFAIESPKRVSSLTLINATPSGFVPQGEMPRYLMEMIQAQTEGKIEDAVEYQLRIWFDGPHREPNEVDPALRERARRMNRTFVANGTFFVADAQPRRPLSPSAIERLATVDVPTLVVSGALDHDENLRANRILVEGIPGSRSATIEGTAHVPTLERPSEFVGSWKEFVSKAFRIKN